MQLMIIKEYHSFLPLMNRNWKFSYGKFSMEKT